MDFSGAGDRGFVPSPPLNLPPGVIMKSALHLFNKVLCSFLKDAAVPGGTDSAWVSNYD